MAATSARSAAPPPIAAPPGRELVVTSNSGTLGSGGLLVSGVLSGDGGLTLTGNGIITLTGANTYTGPTTITTGVLLLPTGTVTADGTPSVLGRDTSPIVMSASGNGIANSRLWATGALTVNRDIQVATGVQVIGLGTAGINAGESLTINGNVGHARD